MGIVPDIEWPVRKGRQCADNDHLKEWKQDPSCQHYQTRQQMSANAILHLLNRRKKYSTQNLPNHSNLLNIQVKIDGIKSVTTTTDKRQKSNSGSKLRVAHLNTRSLKNRSHIVQMRELMRKKNYDVLAVSESWLNSTVTNAEIEMEGYKLQRLDRLDKTGGGVCVYIRAALKVKRLRIFYLGFLNQDSTSCGCRYS